MSSHRRAVDVPVHHIVAALDLLPLGAIQPEKQLYKQQNCKKVPAWSLGQKMVPCCSLLMQHTGGRGILHLNMRGRVQAWSQKHEMGLGDSQADDVAYSVRSLINQLLNLKKKGRGIPAKWRPRYQVLYEKLATEPTGTSDERPAPEVVVQSSTDSNKSSSNNDGDGSNSDVVSISYNPPDHCAAELFSSANPALSELLKRRRIRIYGKSHHPEIEEPSAVAVASEQTAKEQHAAWPLEDIEEMAAGADVGKLGQRAWASLNQTLKPAGKGRAKVVKPAAKEKAAPKPKGKAKARAIKMTFVALLNLEYSKVYHKQRSDLIKAGLSEGDAKKRASEAARACTDVVRGMRAEGHYAEYA